MPVRSVRVFGPNDCFSYTEKGRGKEADISPFDQFFIPHGRHEKLANLAIGLRECAVYTLREHGINKI